MLGKTILSTHFHCTFLTLVPEDVSKIDIIPDAEFASQ